MVDNVLALDALEIENLAARENRGDNLMLFGGGQDEFGVSRGLFESFEESIESLRGKHVNLIDDIHFVFAGLRGHLNLLHKLADVVDTIVGSGIELEDIHGSAAGKAAAAIALAASLHVVGGVGAVDGFGQNTGAGGLTNASWATKKESLGNLVGADGVF